MALITDINYESFCVIAQEEACVQEAYPDGDHFSIGYGHNDEALREGDTITAEEALALLRKDVVARVKIVLSMLKGTIVTPAQLGALVDCYYNKGSAVLGVCDMIRIGDWDEAMARLLSINRNSKGVWKEGLAWRRMREMKMCRHDEYGDLTEFKMWARDPHGTKPTILKFKDVFPKEKWS